MTVSSKKPDLDDITIQIARRMLSAPPKPHEEMKIGKRKPKRAKKTAISGRAKRDLS